MTVRLLHCPRLRGFYGTLGLDSENDEMVLSEARCGKDQILRPNELIRLSRSGAEQLRWRLTNINRAFCPKTVCKRDKGRVLVVITHRTNVTGEGIFTFYSEDARRILGKYQDLCSRGEGRRPPGRKEADLPKSKKNPLSFLFKRETSFCSGDRVTEVK